MDDERIIAYNKYFTEVPVREHKGVYKKNIVHSPLTYFFSFSPFPQKESQAAENESWPKDELLTHDKQVKQVSRFSTIVR